MKSRQQGIFDVEGKADGAHSPAELRVMLQALLAERFRLKLHREMREMPVLRLVIGKDLKLKAAGLAEADPHGFTLRASERGPSFLKAQATAMSLEWLANDLSGHLSRLVVDGTGLKGLFEFDVDFEFDRDDVRDVRVPVREASNHIREGLLSALGLKLQSGKKAQVEVLVIDQVPLSVRFGGKLRGVFTLRFFTSFNFIHFEAGHKVKASSKKHFLRPPPPPSVGGLRFRAAIFFAPGVNE